MLLKQNNNFNEHQEEIRDEITFAELAESYLETLKDYFYGDRAKFIPVDDEMKDDHLRSDRQAR